MAYSITLNVACFFTVVYLVQHYIRQFLEDRRFARFARDHGCEEPTRAKSKLPWGIDFVFKAVTFKGDFLDEIVAEQYREYGNTWSSTGLFGIPLINTIEPKNIQTVLATKFKDWELGELRNGPFIPFIGVGVISSDGAAWEHYRALVRPQFAREQISALEGHEEHMKHLFSAMPVNESGWTGSVGLQQLLYNFTLDTSTDFLFGHSVNSQQAALTAEVGSDEMSFTEAMREAADWCITRMRAQKLYWMITSAKFRRACKTVHHFLDGIIEDSLARQESGEKTQSTGGKKQKYSLVGALGNDTNNVEEIRNQALALLIAGRDTTAGTLGWVFLELARHPEVWNKLRRQILEEFGTEEDEEEITFAKLKSCRYLQHVINETLRLYPAAAVNTRSAVRDTIIPVGGGPKGDKPVAVRRGTLLQYSVYVMHRRPDLWGDDAQEWRPERFAGKSSSWEYLPFNGGPRICLGRK
ncbi:MAG: hypothetical protein M1835_006145 [Candelina submexicana]|nr:MAG: hypothetical protein M1835_006145 [Candelina submexicana]